MSEDRLYHCIVLIMVLLLWKHGDMTGIPAQVVHLTSAPTVNTFESYIFNAKQSNKSGKVQETVVLVLSCSSYTF